MRLHRRATWFPMIPFSGMLIRFHKDTGPSRIPGLSARSSLVGLWSFVQHERLGLLWSPSEAVVASSPDPAWSTLWLSAVTSHGWGPWVHGSQLRGAVLRLARIGQWGSIHLAIGDSKSLISAQFYGASGAVENRRTAAAPLSRAPSSSSSAVPLDMAMLKVTVPRCWLRLVAGVSSSRHRGAELARRGALRHGLIVPQGSSKKVFLCCTLSLYPDNSSGCSGSVSALPSAMSREAGAVARGSAQGTC
mmetsp:Transcript_121171/g.277688  ORF Transcript_121171/g.277688 Transcript_121171/m.277688 type:complete len:248 (+) Transcript_121171:601-1344(+)